MTTWGQALQVYAIIIAVLTPVAALVGVLRTRRWSHAVLLAQLFLLAEVGLVAYAINPDPRPQMSPLLWLAAALLVADVFVKGRGIYRRRRMLRGPISVAQVDRSNARGLISRVLTILVVSAVMLNFAPWLGIANLAGNALWTCLWIPKRMRTYRMEASSAEIAAPPQAVFPYLVDTAKWPLYRSKSDWQVVSVKPPGLLSVGSQILSQMPVSPGKHIKPYVLQSTTEVTAITPDHSYSTVWVDRPSEHAVTELEHTPSGTRVLFRLAGVQPFWPAAMGVMLDVQSLIAPRRADISRNFARLKEILEAAPSQ
jgi:Polyketide cyclase / dehydrase and lipid transport